MIFKSYLKPVIVENSVRGQTIGWNAREFGDWIRLLYEKKTHWPKKFLTSVGGFLFYYNQQDGRQKL